MNRDDVIDVLTAVAAGDRRTVGDADVDVWQAIIGELAKDYALQAVRDHMRDRPGVWLEPGHVYQRARALRRDELDRSGLPAIEPRRDAGDEPQHYPGDLKAAPDLPPYPTEWTTQQRLAAYWHVIRERVTWPRATDNWRAVLNQAERKAERRHA